MRFWFLLFTSALLMLSSPLRAQNRIDQMMEELSTVGGSTFTTAVERNPKTGQVEKVVKKLCVGSYGARTFIDKFNAEAKRHSNTTTNKNGGQTTTVFTCKTKTSNRIYMMKHDNGYHPDATITVIIKMK